MMMAGAIPTAMLAVLVDFIVGQIQYYLVPTGHQSATITKMKRGTEMNFAPKLARTLLSAAAIALVTTTAWPPVLPSAAKTSPSS